MSRPFEPKRRMTDFIHERYKPRSKLPDRCDLVLACPPFRSNVNLSRIVRAAGCFAVRRVICCGTSKVISKIARDGAYIKLTKAENVKFGNLMLPETITESSASGENGLFTLKPEKGTGSLPIGKYRLNHWTVERKDDQGRLWKLKGSGFSAKSSFDINPAKQTQLSIGEPIISAVSARKSNGAFSFSQELKGRLDERIELTRNDAQPQAPKLRIKNEDGTYDRTYSFSYG